MAGIQATASETGLDDKSPDATEGFHLQVLEFNQKLYFYLSVCASVLRLFFVLFFTTAIRFCGTKLALAQGFVKSNSEQNQVFYFATFIRLSVFLAEH